jgi:glycosyltransferase involved in cell wall biosynthesis
MRIALIADRDFFTREHALLNRVTVGLMASGMQVALITANGRSGRRDGGLTARAQYPAARLPWSRHFYAKQVLRQLMAQPWGDAPADVIHAFGEESWGIAVALAEILGVPAVLEIWSADLVRRLPQRRQRAHIGAYTTASSRIADVLASHVSSDTVHVTPWGVLAPPDHEVQSILPSVQDCVSAVVVGSGQSVESYDVVLGGLALARQECPQLIAFVSVPPGTGSRLHAVIRKQGLAEAVSLIPQAESARQLVLRSDLILAPESSGEHRSIMLEAMAAGRLVLAAPDHSVAYLVADKTAQLVPPSTEAWCSALVDTILKPDLARSRAARAREHVASEFTASSYIELLTDVYRRVGTGRTLPFRAP